ncbi:hypothetical protein J4E91_007807 [Alternaria rosae]|nr:hypothetical protein J4E91_007807 [Alternaria rosae]
MEQAFTKKDSAISPATGKAIGQHEAAGLKSLTKEQHLRFWEEVIYWNSERFNEAKWRQVRKKIWRAKEEHCMKVLGWYPPPGPVHEIVTPGGRQLRLYSSNSWTAPTGAHPPRPAHLPRFGMASPTTPRPRWELVSSGPGTPRTATAGPIKNSFAEGGFWESLISPKTPITAVPIATTPVTAVPPSPWSPGKPSTDAEAKATYEEVIRDVSKMALTLCASRHSLRRSFNSENDVIHPSMVRPKDTFLAAQVTLASLKLHNPLSTYIDALLPQKLDSHADDEAAGAKQYRIYCREQLHDVDSWLQFDAQTGELTTILEAQRDLLKMNKDRRKSREMAVGEKGVRLAWAVKVVDDCQYFADVAADGESEGSDEGYEYGNFVRSLGEGDASSLRSNGSTLDLKLTLTNSSNARSSGTEESFGIAQRSSSSPMKPTHEFGYDTLPLRSRNYTLSNLSNAVDPDVYTPPPSHAHSIRRSNATAAPSSSRRNRQASLWINTSLANPPLSASSTMSPQERGTRHKGPSIEDLSEWADELRNMERKRAEMRLDGGFGGRGGRRPRQLRWFSGTERDESRDEGVAEKEMVTKEEGDTDGDGDGLTINGFVHPALRGGGHDNGDGTANWRNNVDVSRGEERNRGASGGSTSTASWRCETASFVERDICRSSIDMDNEVYEESEIDNQTSDYDHDHGDNFNEQTNTDDYDPSDSDTTSSPDHKTTPTQTPLIMPIHPQRTSSSPTHPPIKMSALSNLRLDPPRRPPPPPNRPPPPPMPSCNLRPPAPRPRSIIVPTAGEGIGMGMRYNRTGGTSYERQLSLPPRITSNVPSAFSTPSITTPKRQDAQDNIAQKNEDGVEHGVIQYGVSKASLLQEAVQSRGCGGAQHTRMWSKSGGESVNSIEKEEWDEELKRMEERERIRQGGGNGEL